MEPGYPLMTERSGDDEAAEARDCSSGASDRRAGRRLADVDEAERMMAAHVLGTTEDQRTGGRALRSVCAAALFVLSVQVGVAAGPVTLVRDGVATGAIRVATGTSQPIPRGAQEIQAHTNRMSGARLPVVTGLG